MPGARCQGSGFHIHSQLSLHASKSGPFHPGSIMTSPNPKSEPPRPRPLHISKSFSRVESPPTSPSLRSRSKTFQNGTLPATNDSKRPRGNVKVVRGLSDVFESGLGPYGSEDEDMPNPSGKLPPDFDELPIELISITDSFVDSLSAKIYPVPPSIDKLSELFQNFYENAANHINTHISALSSKQHRASSPAPSSSSAASRFRAKASSLGSKDPPKPERKDSEQQMLTTEEITERKKNRKALEVKKVALEEAVERRVCEGIYGRIWRHRSTQDEAQDEKLRSKTAALSVVEIGLTELGIDLGQDVSGDPEAKKARESEVRESLEDAREELRMMNDKKYPLGKLQHLKAAHKAIVDTLAHFHPSSSADEIMPMMIYTLITSPPQGINVISNLYFIQRFRSASKLDGEAAYCLTNLEAAITFLETVDLASLRDDEMLSGPARASSRSASPTPGQLDPLSIPSAVSQGLYAPAMSLSPIAASPSSPQGIPPAQIGPVSSLRPASQPGNRRLSDLFQPAQALGNAGEAVLKTADQGFTTIGNNLNDSYKFFLGKFKERQNSTSLVHGVQADAPKTLDEARKLVGTPPPEEEGSVSGASSIHSPDNPEKQDRSLKPDDKVLNIIGGRKASINRDRSADSNRSTGSNNKKVAFASESSKEKDKTGTPPAPSNPLESMRNFGKNLDLNPMNRIPGMGSFRGFGRSSTPSTPTPRENIPADGGVTELTTAFPDLAESLPPKEVVKIAPPIKRFMEVQNPGDLKISEVMDLLRDYRRLAGALKDRGLV